MVHTGPLPGTPMHRGESVASMAARAAAEARVLREAGYDAVIVENMHDRPYVHADKLGPEVVSAMSVIAGAVVEALGGADGVPVGVQILSGGNRAALAVALATGARFIRCENFVFSHVADEGLLPEAEAGGLLRYRKAIGAEHVAVFCDVKKKHASHALTADLSLADVVEAAGFFGADGVIVTGTATGRPTSGADVRAAKDAASRATGSDTGWPIPVLVGSGVTPEDATALLRDADGLIVGSWIKRDGLWTEPVDAARARELVEWARR
jgi:membrane complex biogenesis BtpA family protein